METAAEYERVGKKPATRQCRKCRVVLPLDAFDHDGRTKDGLAPRCRVCQGKVNALQATDGDICGPQPQPVGGDAVVIRHVMDDLVSRARAGKEKYGTFLQANNGRNAMVDAYQEALDLCMYLRQAILEGTGGKA